MPETMRRRAVTVTVVALTVALVVVLGLILRDSLRPAAANATSERVSGESLDAILNSADRYFKQGEPGKAEAILKEATRQYADEPQFCVSYAELLVALKRLPEAYAQYEHALALGTTAAETHFAAGTVASAIGKPDRAIEHFAAAQAQDPKDARYPLFLAQVQLKLDKMTEAKTNLLLSARLDPDKAIVWGTLADVALRENHAEIALQHIAKARAIESENVLWRLIEARAKKRLNRAEEALQVLVGLSEADQADPNILSAMAECYGLLRRPGDAAKLYAKHADRQPTEAELAYQAAVWFDRAGENDAAKQYAQRAAMQGHEGAKKLSERLGK